MKPENLAARGGRVLGCGVGRFDLGVDELELLVELCRTLDTIDGLEAGVPSVELAREFRLQRGELRHLTAALGLPDERGRPVVESGIRNGRDGLLTPVGRRQRMAKLRVVEDGSGANSRAIEELVAEVVERQGEVGVYDRPLVQRARSLASAVDADPSNSQLAIQYGLVVKELRHEVLSREADRFQGLMWEISTGCKIHGPNGGVSCEGCCAESAWSRLCGNLESAGEAARL